MQSLRFKVLLRSQTFLIISTVSLEKDGNSSIIISIYYVLFVTGKYCHHSRRLHSRTPIAYRQWWEFYYFIENNNNGMNDKCQVVVVKNVVTYETNTCNWYWKYTRSRVWQHYHATWVNKYENRKRATQCRW